ncbi:MAG TPA: glycosyltransferase family 39 protein [Acidimicrobiales bacterium]|nr:glycosyltransferase family 39 protein [Acidimicrobiales bacterium]
MLAIAAFLLTAHMAVAMWGSSRSGSATFDEPAHIAAAVGVTYDHDLSWNVEHPPLVKLLAGTALRVGGIRASPPPIDEPEGQYVWGQGILYQSGNDHRHVLSVARSPLVLLTCVFALVTFGFATDLFGGVAGLVSLALFTLSPDLLGHGPLVTTDVALAGFVTLTLWMLWRAKHRHRGWLAAAAIAFGLACVTKYTALVLSPIVGALFIAASMARDAGTKPRLRPLAMACAWAVSASMVALAVVWGTYLAVDPRLEYRFDEPALARDATGAMAQLTELAPLPEPYRIGLRYVIGGEQLDRPAFLNGRFYRGGRVDFYPLVLSMKAPVGTIFVLGVALVALAKSRRRDVLVYAVAPCAYTVLVAISSHLNIGVRHVMPAIVLLLVLSGAAVTGRSRLRTGLATLGLLTTAASSWAAYPRYLSYVNELWGGSDNGYRLLADSSIDWGQGLPDVAHYLTEHGANDAGAADLSYFGQAFPTAYGVFAADASRLPDLRDADGLVVVSATLYNLDRERYAALGPPSAVVGDVYLVFDRRSHREPER